MTYAAIFYLLGALACERVLRDCERLDKMEPVGFLFRLFLIAIWPIVFAFAFYNAAYRVGGRK